MYNISKSVVSQYALKPTKFDKIIYIRKTVAKSDILLYYINNKPSIMEDI